MGDGTPLVAMVFLTASLAGVHRVIPGLVEVVAGGGGLLMSMLAAADGRGCGALLGQGGTGVVLVFGSVMWLSAFVRLLGSANPREMARHLLVATAALEIGLFTVSPAGQAVTGVRDPSTVPVLLAAILVVTTLIGCRARTNGFPLLGLGLVTVLTCLALTGSPCSGNPAVSLAGSLTFAMVSLFLTSTNDDLDPTEKRPNEHAYNPV
ncbi:MAG: hypothetical protein ACRD2C_09215 [Acidimicrobiales bacterium]